MVHNPHCLVCSIPIISTSRSAAGVPRALYAPPGLSIASLIILAKSSSEYFPSGPRLRLDDVNPLLGNKGNEATYPAKVRLAGSGSIDAKTLATADRSESVNFKREISFQRWAKFWFLLKKHTWSNGLPSKTLARMSFVHFSSFSERVECHYENFKCKDRAFDANGHHSRDREYWILR